MLGRGLHSARSGKSSGGLDRGGGLGGGTAEGRVTAENDGQNLDKLNEVVLPSSERWCRRARKEKKMAYTSANDETKAKRVNVPLPGLVRQQNQIELIALSIG